MLTYMNAARKPVLFYSGGKDSLATLLLLRPWWSKLDVVWVDTGNQFPEVVQHMRRVASIVPKFTVLHGDTPGFFRENGFPVDVVPTSFTKQGQFIYGQKPVTVCSRFDCCKANIWEPIAAYMVLTKPDLVLRGDRSSERVDPPSECNGTQLRFPIWDWSVEMVREFLEKEAKPAGLLDERHAMSEGSSLDCMTCMAYGCEHAERMKYLKKHHPQMHEVAVQFFDAYKKAVYDDLKEVL